MVSINIKTFKSQQGKYLQYYHSLREVSMGIYTSYAKNHHLKLPLQKLSDDDNLKHLVWIMINHVAITFLLINYKNYIIQTNISWSIFQLSLTDIILITITIWIFTSILLSSFSITPLWRGPHMYCLFSWLVTLIFSLEVTITRRGVLFIYAVLRLLVLYSSVV